MKHFITNKIIRRAIKVLGFTILTFILLPILLYIPPIQNLIKAIAIKEVQKATGMKISIERILLSFPLELNIDKALVLDTAGDTLVASEHLDIDVKLIPLFNRQLDISSANLVNAKYRLLTSDSSMLLNVKVDQCIFDGTSINLATNNINLKSAFLKGGDVSVHFDNEKSKPTPKDTTKSTPWVIKAKLIKMEDVHYTMQMLPIIDDIDAQIATAELREGYVNIGTREIKARYLNIDKANAKYYTPSPEFLASYIAPPKDSTETIPEDSAEDRDWTITGDNLSITNATGLYAQRGAIPQPGLDLNVLQGNKINIVVADFYNRATNVRVPVKSFSGAERCGIEIEKASGIFEMNKDGMSIEKWDIKTNLSTIYANAFFAPGVFEKNSSSQLNIKIDASIYLGEILALYPSYSKLLKTIPSYSNATAKIDIAGNLSRLRINEVSAKLPKYATLSLTGAVTSLHTPKKIGGDLIIDGNFQNINFIKPTILDAKMSKEIYFPPLKLRGKASMHGSNYAAIATMRIPTGKIAMDVKLNNINDNFALECNLDSFPIEAIMPLGDLGRITASVSAKGKGFDILNPKNSIDAYIHIDKCNYKKHTYQNITAKALLIDGDLDAQIISNTPNFDFDIDVKSTIANKHYNYIFNSNIRNLNLEALGLYKDKSNGSLTISSAGDINISQNIFDITLDIQDINWEQDSHTISTPELNLLLQSSNDKTHISFLNEGLSMEADAKCSVDTLIKGITNSSDTLFSQIKKTNFDFNKIVDCLPYFTFESSIKGESMLSDYLHSDEISFNEFKLNINKDSTIHINSRFLKLSLGAKTLDTINISANELNQTLNYNFHIGNKKGNIDAFASTSLSGEVNANYLTALFTQKNAENETRFNLGIKAQFRDSSLMFNFFPENPTIGFRKWALNDNNFLEYDYNKHIDANLLLKSDSSYLSIKTNRELADNQEGVDIKIAEIRIEEWLNMSPFSPTIKGVLNSTLSFSYDGKDIGGNGNIEVSKFNYGNKQVGDFLFDINLAADPNTGYTNAKASLAVNGQKALMAQGVINDSTSKTPYRLNLDITQFPLSIANPFIPQNLAKVEGYANGEIIITGSFDKPILNGYIEYDSTTIHMPSFGSKLKLPKTKIPVDSSNIIFNNYNVTGLNDSPLSINGNVQVHSLTNPVINLTLLGRNVQFVNSKRTNQSEVFGKGNLNINANMNGQLSNLNINAKLDILGSTDLTYVMQTSVNSITESKTSNVVRFVQFNDTTANINNIQEEPSFNMAINANINIEPGAKFTVNISPEGKNKVEIVGSGNLTYTQPADGAPSFMGQYTVSMGFARYSPPLISEQLFNINAGSSVIWMGDILNPILNIKANEIVKVNVTPEGEDSRSVNFDITLIAKNTLNNMDLSFDLSTKEDATIYSELQAMTPEQRSTQAMNIILYKKYIGSSAQAESKYFGNPLYSFLAGQLNNWASQNLKGIDLSFGVNQYNRTYDGNTTLATNYSYQVSKSFLNNRFKVIVGGSYDTDYSTEQTIAEDLFNDISVEYLITPSGSVYAKLFRHTGFINMFEGQITQTGAAIVLRRKLSTLKDIFRFKFETHHAVTPPLVDKKDEK